MKFYMIARGDKSSAKFEGSETKFYLIIGNRKSKIETLYLSKIVVLRIYSYL